MSETLSVPLQYVKIGPGNVNILLTSPHGGKGTLGNTKVRSKKGCCNIKDFNANLLLESILHHVTQLSGGLVCPYFAMGLCHRKFCDLNRSPDTAYEEPEAKDYYDLYHSCIKGYLEDMTKQFPNRKHYLLLDIHGQSTLRDRTMRGTQNGQTVHRLIKTYGDDAILGEKSLFGQLHNKGFGVYPSNDGPDKWVEHQEYNGGWTVCYYSATRKWPGPFSTFVDAIQMEIGYEFRKDEESINKFGLALAGSLLEFHKYYLTEEK